MSVTMRRLRQAAAVAIAAVTVLGAAAACGDDKPAATGEKPAKLVLDTFGEFGYEDLVTQYKTADRHRGRATQDGDLGDYRNKLVRYLATGRALPTSPHSKRASSTSSS